MKKIFIVILLWPFLGHTQIIATIAGNGTPGYFGDGGQATAAMINLPGEVVADGAGNIYFAELSNHRIRKISTSGIISTVAGTGTAGYNGDGIAATAAQLNTPYGVALDKTGNLYIGDAFNQRIRKVTPAGIITTFAGTGVSGYFGDGSAATAAQLWSPMFLRTDTAGNVYVADNQNHAIRKINTTGVITTVAGNGTSGYFGDGGPATAAHLYAPQGMYIDVSGNLFISDAYNNVIRKVSTSGVITTVAGNGAGGFSGSGVPATAAMLNLPNDVFLDSIGNMYIADNSNERIRKVNTSGIITTVVATGVAGYSGDGGSPILAELNGPSSIHITNAGKLYISDANNSRIRVINFVTTGTGTFINCNESISIFPNPTNTSLTISSSDKIKTVAITNLTGQTVYIHEYNSNKVQVDVTDLPACVYFIKINGSEVRKFVKE